jgi:hypothetical protein
MKNRMRLATATAGAAAILTAAVSAQGNAVIVSDLGLNVALQAQNANYRFAHAEFITADAPGQFAGEIIASDRGNKKLSSDFVPGDPNRFGTNDISYIVDLSEGAASGGLSAAETAAEIERSMRMWDAVECSSGLSLTNFGAHNIDLGVVQNILGFGGVGGWAADLTHAGWLPKAFFDAIAPGGGDFILGVTFTFIWIDDLTGEPSDMDANGRDDVAFREIYYNNDFDWRIGPYVSGLNFDAFSVILHEAGHGLSQAHFGKVFLKSNGTLQYSPFAVMNAVASRRTTHIQLEGTDNGGHCSNWGSWPNN